MINASVHATAPSTHRSGAPSQSDSAALPPVELIHASKHYGATLALDNVTITAQAGEVLAVLGPNGAGKTTAINLMLGLAKLSSGEARLFGANPRSAASKMRVGVMLQISGVPETLTVREHLTSFATYYPAPLTVNEALEVAGLAEVRNRAYGKLSGGQKQRLHFALAMIGNPDLLFLDEPTTGLDVAARRDFWTRVRDFLGGGRTVVLTTHYLEEADALADRIVVLHHGKVLAEGSPAEIKGRVAGRRVRAATSADPEAVRALPGVKSVERSGGLLTIITSDSEGTVRGLLELDAHLSNLEVSGAGLEEAFLSLTDDHNEVVHHTDASENLGGERR